MPRVLCTDSPLFITAHFFVHDNQILALIFYISKDFLVHAFLQKIHICTDIYQDNDYSIFLVGRFCQCIFFISSKKRHTITPSLRELRAKLR